MDYNIKQIKPMQVNTREELDRYLADVCQVVRDKDIKNPHKLTDRLMKESFGGKASSVLAFVPCIINADEDIKGDGTTPTVIQRFGFFEKDGTYHTNLRELLNLGTPLEEAIKFIDFTHYKAITARVPYFIYQQIRTHTQINFLSHSARYSDIDYGYFKPDEMYQYSNSTWSGYVENTPPKDLIQFMKDAGVVRKEIYNRGGDMLRIRPFTMGFNTLNPYSWEHFKNERQAPHTQAETRDFVKALCESIKI